MSKFFLHNVIIDVIIEITIALLIPRSIKYVSRNLEMSLEILLNFRHLPYPNKEKKVVIVYLILYFINFQKFDSKILYKYLLIFHCSKNEQWSKFPKDYKIRESMCSVMDVYA